MGERRGKKNGGEGGNMQIHTDTPMDLTMACPPPPTPSPEIFQLDNVSKDTWYCGLSALGYLIPYE